MKGFVPTPPHIVDHMVAKLFEKKFPEPEDTILDPGCGRGAFIDGIIRWCEKNNTKIPRITGIDSDPKHITSACEKYSKFPSIHIRHEDFLLQAHEKFKFIIGNPPYVSITGLTEPEKNVYRTLFHSATGRFDLYFLFFEQALNCLENEGRLVFITPEKYLSVKSASQLRIILSRYSINEIDLVHEHSFGKLVTYPAVTTITHKKPGAQTAIIFRNGSTKSVRLPKDGTSAFPILYGKTEKKSGHCTLGDLCLRVSCGVATGADAVYIHNKDEIPSDLKKYAFPTITGRDLSINSSRVQSELEMIMPYEASGKLIPENQLGALKTYLAAPENHIRLLKRTCVSKKPWYAYHETPPLAQILQRKILCKDITETPFFRIDYSGEIVPSHSVYYIIPKNPDHIETIHEYLNSHEVRVWLESNCQRAANGFFRLQSTILKQIPVPFSILENEWLSCQKVTRLHVPEQSGEVAG
ncbi:MAG: TaqI-like C-terminal specificity domain-containing protein [Methanomicrobiales archaeon]